MADNEHRLRLVIEAVNKAVADLNRVKGDVDKIVQGLDQIGRSGKKAETTMERMAKASRNLAASGAQLIGIGTALAGMTFFPILAAARFEKAMAGVLAVTDGASESFEALNQTASELGRTTKFTATQAAEGMVFLGMAGFDAAEVMGAIGPALKLASAGSLTLAEAADIASNVLQAMRLPVEELTHVTDVLANTAASSNTNIRQMAQALKYVGPAAAASGISLEEIAAAVGVLGNAGIQGTMAGTSLRTMLVNLSQPAPKAIAALESLGVTIAKTNDGSLDFLETMRRLHDANMGLGEATSIFQRRAAAGAIAIADQIDKMEELALANLTATDAASKMASIMIDNVVGAFILLKSAADGLMRAIGDPLLTPLKNLLQVLATTTTNVSEVAERFSVFTKGILGVAGAVGLLLVGLGGLELALSGVMYLVSKTATWAALNID
jgi:TP901 family phage tail tape measure protein